MNDEAGYISKFTGQVLVPVVTPAAGQSEAECKHCGRTFYAKRSDARFCSANCRKASSRRASQIKREAARIRSMIDRVWSIAGDDEKLQVIAALETDAIRSKCDTRRDDTS